MKEAWQMSEWINEWMLASMYGIFVYLSLLFFLHSERRTIVLNFVSWTNSIMNKEHTLPTSVFYLSFQVLLKSTPPLGFSWFPNLKWPFSPPIFSSTFWLYLTFDIHHVLHLLVIIFFVLSSCTYLQHLIQCFFMMSLLFLSVLVFKPNCY